MSYYDSGDQRQTYYEPDSSTPPPPPPKPSDRISSPAAQDTFSRSGYPAAPPPVPPPPQHTGDDAVLHAAEQSHSQPPPDAGGPPDGWLPEGVKDRSTIDLQNIHRNPTLLTALVHAPQTCHPSLPLSQEPLTRLLASNTALATSLQNLESHLRQLRAGTQSRLLSQRALERQWRAKQAEVDTSLRDFSPQGLYQRLAAAVAEQEAICRGLEETFLEGSGSSVAEEGADVGVGAREGGGGVATEREVVEFVKRAREARKTAHLRRERKERWDEGRVGGWR